jgi:23S rRNA (uracil1939-C5)-methyltransferase
LALKTDIVADQLARIGGFEDADVAISIAAPQQWHYRHDAILYPQDGGFAFGDSRFRIDECHIITPELLALMEQLDFELPTLTHVILRENGLRDLMVILSTEDDEAPELEVDLSASVNFLLSDDEPANLIGSTHLNYQLLGKKFRATAGSFMRGNLHQTETLLTTLRGWLDLRGDESILDLYCGVGLIAATLAPDANLVTCVDSYPPAMTDAEENLADFDNVDLIEGDVADVLPDLAEEAYHVAIVDPPAEGMSTDAIDALESALPPRLIYIGDDPATLVRDAKRLAARYDYRLGKVQPIDFEPQTFRTVTLADFHRSYKKMKIAAYMFG